MTVIKRTKKASADDLVNGLERFIYLLEGQGEADAVLDLGKALAKVKKFEAGSSQFNEGIAEIANAFEEHELSAYTHRRSGADKGEWSDADELYLASTKVQNLMSRFKH